MSRATNSSSSTKAWDVIVVGARCAGAATAMLLARAGIEVLMLDAARAGSDTLSTHALMRGGVMQLHRWGLLDEVVAAGTPAISRADFHYGANVSESVEIRRDLLAPALYAPRRTVLDTILADAAARAGVTVKHGARVIDVLLNDDHVATGVRWTESGRLFSADAALIIGADGRSSTVAHLVGAQKKHTERPAGGMLLAYWSGLDRHAYQWFYDLGGTAGVIPTNDGQACVWVGMPASRFRAGTSLDALYSELLGQVAPTLDLSRSQQHGPVRGYPGAPGFVRESTGPGWALVGDAGYFKDPITAHGMTDALRDAELLARAVIAAPSPGEQQTQLLHNYQDTRDALSRQLRAITNRIASYEWDLGEIQDLLPELGRAMRPEVATMREFGNAPLVTQTAKPRLPDLVRPA